MSHLIIINMMGCCNRYSTASTAWKVWCQETNNLPRQDRIIIVSLEILFLPYKQTWCCYYFRIKAKKKMCCQFLMRATQEIAPQIVEPVHGVASTADVSYNCLSALRCRAVLFLVTSRLQLPFGTQGAQIRSS